MRIHRTGTKTFRHPAVGVLELVHHSTTLPTEGAEDLLLTTCTAEPGTASADALELLASWAATTAEPSREGPVDLS